MRERELSLKDVCCSAYVTASGGSEHQGCLLYYLFCLLPETCRIWLILLCSRTYCLWFSSFVFCGPPILDYLCTFSWKRGLLIMSTTGPRKGFTRSVSQPVEESCMKYTTSYFPIVGALFPGIFAVVFRVSCALSGRACRCGAPYSTS